MFNCRDLYRKYRKVLLCTAAVLAAGSISVGACYADAGHVLSDEEYAEFLINHITKDECEYILGLMPDEMDGSIDQDRIHLIVDWLNLGYDKLEGETSGQDLSLSAYNRCLALVTDYTLTPENAGEFELSPHFGVYESNGEWFLPYYGFDADPFAEAEIIDAVENEDELLIRYHYTNLSADNKCSVSAGETEELCAHLTEEPEGSGYRVMSISKAD